MALHLSGLLFQPIHKSKLCLYGLPFRASLGRLAVSAVVRTTIGCSAFTKSPRRQIVVHFATLPPLANSAAAFKTRPSHGTILPAA